MSELLDPEAVLELVAAQIPRALRKHVLIVGSLAAAYHHRAKLAGGQVKTKDADILIHPAGALEECRRLAEGLLHAGWRPRLEGPNPCKPQSAKKPIEALAVIRLNPPKDSAYFVELLALPAAKQAAPKVLNPCKLKDGWYCVPSFRFMSVLAEKPQAASGLSYARPSMMALANLLSHPVIGTATISEPLEPGGPKLLRSAKDLGRVLALARLAEPEELDGWSAEWQAALKNRFKRKAPAVAKDIGAGLEALRKSDLGMEDALHAVQVGLLAGFGVTRTQLDAIAGEVLELVAKPVSRAFDR